MKITVNQLRLIIKEEVMTAKLRSIINYQVQNLLKEDTSMMVKYRGHQNAEVDPADKAAFDAELKQNFGEFASWKREDFKDPSKSPLAWLQSHWLAYKLEYLNKKYGGQTKEDITKKIEARAKEIRDEVLKNAQKKDPRISVPSIGQQEAINTAYDEVWGKIYKENGYDPKNEGPNAFLAQTDQKQIQRFNQWHDAALWFLSRKIRTTKAWPDTMISDKLLKVLDPWEYREINPHINDNWEMYCKGEAHLIYKQNTGKKAADLPDFIRSSSM